MKSLGLYRMSVYSVAFAGALSLAPGQGSLVGPGLFLVLSAILWFARARLRVLPPKTPKVSGLLAAFLAVSAAACLLAARSLGEGVSMFSVVAVPVAFFMAFRPRHYTLVTIAALAQVTAASFNPGNVLFLLLLVYFAAVAAFSLGVGGMVEGIRSRKLSAGKDAADPPALLEDPADVFLSSRPGANAMFLWALKWSAALVPLAALIFLALPRPSNPLKSADAAARPGPRKRAPAAEAAKRPPESKLNFNGDIVPGPGPGGGDEIRMHIGFAGDIDINVWGSLFESEREVLAVFVRKGDEAGDFDPDDLYLKGLALDAFDGRRWWRSSEDVTRIEDGDDGEVDRKVTFEPYDPSDPRILQLFVWARSEFGPIRFHAPKAVSFLAPAAFLDSNGALFARPDGIAAEETENYIVTSMTMSRIERTELDSSSSTAPEKRFLAVPGGHERVTALARSIWDPGKRPFVNTRFLSAALQNRCKYTKKPHVPAPDRQPLEEFLFERRAGHCELFASAFTVMLRSCGVAARVVCGFRGGAKQVDEFGQPYVAVRESDAHAWVEAWFDDYGWVQVDPTPCEDRAEPGPLDLKTPPAAIRESGAMSFFVEYDNESRNKLVGGAIRKSARAAGSALSTAFSWAKRFAVPLLMILMVAGAVAAVLLSDAKSRKRAKILLGSELEPSRRRAVGFYLDFLEALASKGFKRSPRQTPLEFAEELSERAPHLKGVRDVTELFHRVRYRGDEPERAELAMVRGVIKSLRRG